MRVLLLGGTAEAGEMARALAEARIDAVYSYAGRTAAPLRQPLPQRIGGFGGVEGLCSFLADTRITHVIDATHPFAAGMSVNALAATKTSGLPLIALERPPWTPVSGDRWTCVPDLAAAVTALPGRAARVFLAIGRQHLGVFARAPQHHYLLRLVDPPDTPTALSRTTIVISRGPFTVAGDTALLQEHRTDIIVAKNAGGTGAVAKLHAARALEVPVILIARPTLPARASATTVPEVMAWLHATPPARRGA